MSKKPKYKLALFWDNARAEYWYMLQEWCLVGLSADPAVPTPVEEQEINPAIVKPPTNRYVYVASGDLAWAKRTAKYYGLELPIKETKL